MSHKGNIQLTVIFTATPDLVEQGDQVFESHAAWMAESHYREGEKALLRYNVAKGPDLSNPLDPSSEPTGNTSFVLMEVYESEAGVEDHWGQAAESWNDFSTLGAWASQCKVTTVHGSLVASPLPHPLTAPGSSAAKASRQLNTCLMQAIYEQHFWCSRTSSLGAKVGCRG